MSNNTFLLFFSGKNDSVVKCVGVLFAVLTIIFHHKKGEGPDSEGFFIKKAYQLCCRNPFTITIFQRDRGKKQTIFVCQLPDRHTYAERVANLRFRTTLTFLETGKVLLVLEAWQTKTLKRSSLVKDL